MCRAREVLDDLATPGAAEVLAIPTPPEITPMPVNRHQQARTTPAIRQELRESPLSMAALARRYHLTQATGRQWCQWPPELTHLRPTILTCPGVRECWSVSEFLLQAIAFPSEHEHL